MRVLCIGNSFSQDATRFLHQLSDGANLDLTCVNLYIGGCSLKRHWDEYTSGNESYSYEYNGEPLHSTALLPALQEGDWDIVTLQQVSQESGMYETFQPWLDQLAELIHREAPSAQIYLHETWAYESDSTHSGFVNYECSQEKMYSAILDAYAQAQAHLGAGLLPVGQAVQLARQCAPFRYSLGEQSLCRDGYHLNLLKGRYLAACVMMEALTGINALKSSFIPVVDGETLTAEERAVLCYCAHKAVLGEK